MEKARAFGCIQVSVDLGTAKIYYHVFCKIGTPNVSPVYEK